MDLHIPPWPVTLLLGYRLTWLTVAVMCTSVCFKSAIISVLIAGSHSDDNHVTATAPCMPCTCIHMHFAQARPPMSCIPLVIITSGMLSIVGRV